MGQPLDVGAAQGGISGQTRRTSFVAFQAGGWGLHVAENFLLNRKFALVGKLISIAGKYFDSVIRPRIVRRGDHHAGVEIAQPGEIGNAGRGDHARALDRNAVRGEPLQEAIGNPLAGLARVLTDNSASFWIIADQIVPESPSDHIGACRRKGELSRHAANAIGSEKLSLIAHSSVSVRAGSAGGLLHDNGYVDRSRMDYLD